MTTTDQILSNSFNFQSSNLSNINLPQELQSYLKIIEQIRVREIEVKNASFSSLDNKSEHENFKDDHVKSIKSFLILGNLHLFKVWGM